MDPLAATREVFEPGPRVDGNHRLAQRLTVLSVVVLVVVLGALVFLRGPLPTIFPTLNCGGCVSFRP